MPDRKMLIPIITSIEPPRMVALPASFVPKDFPRNTPNIQMMKVTTAMISAQRSAMGKLYSDIVKPTESASIEVATP